MFNLEKAHFILDEMVANGKIVDVNRKNILAPLYLIDESEASS
jgi:AP-4 complex subunit sigma-1